MKCAPDRIEPRITALRMSDTPWEEIARILEIPLEDVHLHKENIIARRGLTELTKASLTQLSRRIQATHAREKLGPAITKRQDECLRLYARGLTYREIAFTMQLRNPQTVQNHVSQACKAMGILHAGRHRLQKVQEHFRPGPKVAPLNGDPCF